METNANGDCQQPYHVFRIVVKLKEDLHLHFLLEKFQKKFPGISINGLFNSLSNENIKKIVHRARKSDPTYRPPDFFSFYAINCPEHTDPNEVLQSVVRNENVELAYIENGPISPPSVPTNDGLYNRQEYHAEAPCGINACYAWKFKGGKGDSNVKFIDIEQGWILNHENIFAKTFRNTGLNYKDFQDHGAAVLGVVCMQNNSNGGVGIVPSTNVQVISQWRPDGFMNTADAIMTALSHLNYGDIILLETQAFETLESDKALPCEFHEANFQAIRLATELGIIVIETAGNGSLGSRKGNDLDVFEFNGKKIFDQNSTDFRDPGAILVGAATASIPHRRISYSNYGSRVDCYAWGENVPTAGSYPESSGNATDKYTRKFSGTSAAAAIVAGAAIAVQSICEENFGYRLSPKQMRDIFKNDFYGTASANGRLIDKIGVMPDLKKIIQKKLKIKKKINRSFKNSVTINS
jgi:hypothetical protein